MEIAFISADRLHIELLKTQGKISGRLLGDAVKKPAQFYGTMLVGNTAALVVFGIYMANLLDPYFHDTIPAPFNNDIAILILSSLTSTVIVLVTAEFLPKSISMINPERLLTLFSGPIALIYYLMYPIIFIITKLVQLILGIFGIRYSEEEPVFGMHDLNNYIKNIINRETTEEDAEVDAKIFSNALEFKTVKARECMIPRTEIIAVDVEDDINELKEAFVDSGHSKVLVYRDSIDDVIGYAHSLALFKKPKTIKEILTPVIIVPETMLVNELMIQFITKRKSIALVVDEFGGTSGIISMEDIIEEIFGEIQDEHDDEYLVEDKIDENSYMLSARHEIDYLNEKYSWELPTGDYDTLGGLILAVNENIPDVNEVIKFPPFTATICSIDDTRIGVVKLTRDPSGSMAG